MADAARRARFFSRDHSNLSPGAVSDWIQTSESFVKLAVWIRNSVAQTLSSLPDTFGT